MSELRWRLIAHHTDGALSISTVYSDGILSTPMHAEEGDRVPELSALVEAAAIVALVFGPEQVALLESQRRAIERLRVAVTKVGASI